MVIIKQEFIEEVITSDPWLFKIYDYLINDLEVKTLLEMSNVMVVNRLKYNDHGIVHAKLTACTATYLLKILVKHGVEPTLIKDNVVDDVKYTYIVSLIGGLLHDIGNSIHRDMHEKIGVCLAKPIIERVLDKFIDDYVLKIKLRQEILHSIHCTAYDVDCLTLEAGCVKVADGLDMAEGRARIPYKLGGISIHSVSALSIERVEVVENNRYPIVVNIYMNEKAGVFQVDEILLPKVKSTLLKKYICINVLVNNNLLKTYVLESVF